MPTKSSSQAGERTRNRRIKFTKWGMAENPIGLQVALPFDSVHSTRHGHLLGDVIGWFFNEAIGMTMLKVRHFNGEMWPMEVSATAVEVLG